MQKITPFLWFDHQAEEAARFYTHIFKNSKITSEMRYSEDSHGEPGSMMTVTFEIQGQTFTALNGGPVFSFTPAISFFVNCETQEEVDYLWEALSEGGEQEQCGWLRDKLGELLSDPDPEKVKKVTEVMLTMGKLDIARLEAAYEVA
jgi:predicted 3-demethylubiquinone-9 3-methyltransferase (glyoxalase superfamily)